MQQKHIDDLVSKQTRRKAIAYIIMMTLKIIILWAIIWQTDGRVTPETQNLMQAISLEFALQVAIIILLWLLTRFYKATTKLMGPMTISAVFVFNILWIILTEEKAFPHILCLQLVQLWSYLCGVLYFNMQTVLHNFLRMSLFVVYATATTIISQQAILNAETILVIVICVSFMIAFESPTNFNYLLFMESEESNFMDKKQLQSLKTLIQQQK